MSFDADAKADFFGTHINELVGKGGDVDGAGLKSGEGVGEAMTPLLFAWFTPAAKPDFHAGRTRKNAEMMNELTITPIQGRN